jgi:hypothetical protein
MEAALDGRISIFLKTKKIELMASEVKPIYHCSQPELYAIWGLAWAMAKEAQAQIVVRYPAYTLGYINGKIAKVEAAEAIPDEQARDSVSEIARNTLKQKSALAVENWDFLTRYIIASLETDKDNIKPSLEAAGKQYREEAGKEEPNWDMVKQLLTSGKSYIANNTLALTPFMPVTFAADYDTTRDEFLLQYGVFTMAEGNSSGGTYDKITANNNIQDDGMQLLGDLVLLSPPELKNEMTFTHLKNLISSPGPAGYKGKVTDSVTGLPIAGVLLRLTPSGEEAITNATGDFDFGNISSGKYVLEIIKDGYATQTVNITIHVGVTSTDDYVLVAI